MTSDRWRTLSSGVFVWFYEVRTFADLFAGIVEELGSIASIESRPPGVRLVVRAPLVSEDAGMGDSISTNGCCLTVVDIDGDKLSFDAGPETLTRTNLGMLDIDSTINLERSLKIGDRLGGHFVTGHIDGAGSVAKRVDEKNWSTIWFEAPAELLRQMASKGSIAIDGVSLTLVEVTEKQFSVQLIPHTLKVTTLGNLQVGDRVNLETDVLAKYVQQQLSGSATQGHAPQEHATGAPADGI